MDKTALAAAKFRGSHNKATTIGTKAHFGAHRQSTGQTHHVDLEFTGRKESS